MSVRRTEVYATVNKIITVTWSGTPCTLVDWLFRNVGANGCSEMLVPIYQITRHHIPQDCYPQPSRSYAQYLAVIGTDKVSAQERNITVYAYNYAGLVIR
jgi:hypothetical protein